MSSAGVSARLNAATNEAMKDLIIATNDHVDEFKALSQQLKSLVREVKKTAEYFLDEPAFREEYAAFMEDRGEEVEETTQVDDWEISLFLLYSEVISAGGYVQVNHELGWNRIWQRLPKISVVHKTKAARDAHGQRRVEVPFTYALEVTLKENYVFALYPFELYKRKTLVES